MRHYIPDSMMPMGGGGGGGRMWEARRGGWISVGGGGIWERKEGRWGGGGDGWYCIPQLSLPDLAGMVKISSQTFTHFNIQTGQMRGRVEDYWVFRKGVEMKSWYASSLHISIVKDNNCTVCNNISQKMLLSQCSSGCKRGICSGSMNPGFRETAHLSGREVKTLFS